MAKELSRMLKFIFVVFAFLLAAVFGTGYYLQSLGFITFGQASDAVNAYFISVIFGFLLGMVAMMAVEKWSK